MRAKLLLLKTGGYHNWEQLAEKLTQFTQAAFEAVGNELISLYRRVLWKILIFLSHPPIKEIIM